MGLNKYTRTNVNGAAQPWQVLFFKVVFCGIWVCLFVSVFFCYPADAAHVNSRWVLSFKHIKRLEERLILQESKNRPNVFCCEYFVDTK